MSTWKPYCWKQDRPFRCGRSTTSTLGFGRCPACGASIPELGAVEPLEDCAACGRDVP